MDLLLMYACCSLPYLPMVIKMLECTTAPVVMQTHPWYTGTHPTNWTWYVISAVWCAPWLTTLQPPDTSALGGATSCSAECSTSSSKSNGTIIVDTHTDALAAVGFAADISLMAPPEGRVNVVAPAIPAQSLTTLYRRPVLRLWGFPRPIMCHV